ncbi:MAG: exosortase-dependent surface protein XDP1 [Alteromonas sp.]|uniref:exosortase-dependent surface protein XDP1 n=1 Tax=Alteromonas sp. TaxID=232 RepID=UPI0032D9105F
MRLSSIIKMSILTTGLLAINAAMAGNHNNKNFSHCNSTSKGASSECNSPLGENVYNLVDHGTVESTNASSSKISIGGVNVAISGWSDTYGYNDDIVVGAKLEKISDYYGYGVTNDDWETYYNPDHAIDNVNKVRGNITDYDFVLLSFDKAVTLTGTGFSWIADKNDTQVSVAALSNTSTLISGVSTWSDIVADALTTASFDIKGSGDSDYAANFTFKDTANYWLIGAYNTVFGNIGGYVGNDAFKLASVGFSLDSTPTTESPTEVNEPGTIGLLAAGSFLLLWRRKKF